MKNFLKLFPVPVFLVVWWLASCGVEKRENALPNIVYILTDDMGYGDVSALNEDAAWKTVHMDRLASEGMVFTDAHSESAVCTPTRYGILTGRFSWRSRLKRGVLGGYSEPLIEKERMTVASLLKKKGYETACIGKWHLGLGWQFVEGMRDSIDFTQPLTDTPNDHGFDYSYIIPASLDMAPYVYIENDHVTAVPDRYTENRIKYGWWRKGLTAPDFVHEQVLPHLTRQSVRFIREHVKKDPGRPFFLYFPMNAPHTPILPTEAFRGKSGTNPYGDYVLEVDAMVGRVMQAVKEAGVEENTIFIVTSDNGCSPEADYEVLARFGHNPSYIFRGTKSDIWEGGHRIPFIVRWPAVVKAGSRCRETVCLNDLMATVAAITGEKLPENAGGDSYNILTLLRGEKSDTPVHPSLIHHSIDGSFALRRGSWKLEMCRGSGGWSLRERDAGTLGLPPLQLYDLDEDVSETINLWKQHPERVKEMEEELKRMIINGRTTPGTPLSQVIPEKWPGMWWNDDR